VYPIYFRDAEHTNSRVWLVARCKPDERHARLFLSQRFDPAPVHFSDFLGFFNDRLEAYSKGEISPNTFEMQLNSWIGHARQADTWRLQGKLFRYLCSRGLNVCKKDTAWKLLEWRPIKNGRHS